MKLFGWKAGREESRPVLSRVGASRAIGDWPVSYEAQVRESYGGNAIAQRAVRLVADGLGEAPLSVSSPEIERLVRARSGGQALLATLAAQLLLHGNAYVQVLCDASGQVCELFALRPERVTVEPDAGGWPVAYSYRVGERTVRLAADETRPAVIHIRTFSPVDDHYGLGCLGAAAGAVAVHNAAARWNKALLDNAARPSGALVYESPDGAALSGEQFARWRGRRGTEAAIGRQAAGDRFVLIEPDAVTAIDLPLASLRTTVRVIASGIGDAEPVAAAVVVQGSSVLPPAPVQLRATLLAGGDTRLSWVRRSRAGWRWPDGADVPLAEERESYRVTIKRGDGGVRTVETVLPELVLPMAERSGTALTVEVRQVGSYGESAAAAIALAAN